MSSYLRENIKGSYRFLPGIDPYSSGVIADPGFEIVHATLANPLPWRDGLMAVRQYLEESGLQRHSLCGVELRCAEPHEMDGFVEFNRGYHALLEEWDLLVDGANPVARTNVAPVVSPPVETVLFGFSFTRASETEKSTFVVAGGGELPTRKLDRDRIVRVGETSRDALLKKAECVLDIMRLRLERLDADVDLISTINVYTAHELHGILSDVVLLRLPMASQTGVHWSYARPPVREIEFEMDIRGVSRDITVSLG